MLLEIIAFILAYLLGSINCAIIICKIGKFSDPRSQGSGNPGASNVLRVAGKKYAILTLIGDALKGTIAVLVAMLLGLHGAQLGLIAFVAVIGHMYPIFFKFQGGKGVATALGSILALSPLLALIGLIVWIVLVVISRYSSLGSLVACIVVALTSLFIAPAYFPGLVAIAVFIIWRHRANIRRLKAGTENKLASSGKK